MQAGMVERKMNQINIKPATQKDLPAIRALLKENGLPLDGFPQDTPVILAAFNGTYFAGSAAIEIHGSFGLLRSVAVKVNQRGLQLGTHLVQSAQREAENLGLQALFLLTETAGSFFPRFGFEVLERSEVPATVRKSIEFTTACADTAVAMRLALR